MRRSKYAIALLFVAGTMVDCECSDNLSSIVGRLHLELCSSSPACGCESLSETDATIDFGNPEVGESAMRTIIVINDNAPQKLVIDELLIDDPSGGFEVRQIRHWTSDASDATFASWDMANGSLTLYDQELAEVVIIYEPGPTTMGEHTATLTVRSNSSTRPRWDLTLRGGSAEGVVDLPDQTCPAEPLTLGEPNCVLDFGTFADVDTGPDPEKVPLPLALGEEEIVVTNNGARVLFLTVMLTDDGIPETDDNEPVGELGVFHLKPFGCTEIQPGESMSIGVEFRPFEGGAFRGEVKLGGLERVMRVELVAKVTGPKVCITTEDDSPQDSELVFGQAPSYLIPKNAEPSDIETRHIYIENCGFEAFLEINDAIPSTTLWNDGFQSDWLPWAEPAPLGVGEQIAVPFEFVPQPEAVVNAVYEGSLAIKTNARNDTTYARLRAKVDPEQNCLLAASPSPLEFGWVAANENGSPLPCPPFCTGEEPISRTEAVIFSNAGQRACTNISLVEPDGADLDPGNVYRIIDNPNGNPFTVQPGVPSQPVAIEFLAESTEDPVNYLGKLPYVADGIFIIPQAPTDTCPDDHNCITLRARGGGNPNCAITFAPVNTPGIFCQGYDWVLPFGNVNIGQEQTIDLKMINTGSDTCNITAVTLTSSGVFSIVQPTLPLVITVNSFETVPVTFAPVPPSGNNPFDELPFGCNPFALINSGEESLTVDHQSATTGDTGTQKIALSGKGTRPDIDVIPSQIDFGDVTVGCCSADVRVAIYNSGDGTLTINGLGFGCDAAGNCDAWSGADAANPTDPGFQMVTQPDDLELAPGENTEFNVRFCAAAEGAHTGVLEIISTDDNEEYFTVSLAANGTYDDQGVDDFTQPLRPMVDVLWVVDDSGSMGEEQQNLANNFSSFINSATALDTDYHLGVISTYVEGEEGGMLYACSGPLWISDTQAIGEQQNQFRCNVKTTDWPRPNSDSQEAGLQAARLALDYPHIDGHNAGFYREEAKLYIIIVTDEVDQSDGTPQQYVDYFRNLKGLGNPDLLNISAVSGLPPDGCETAESNQPDYDAVNLVGGQFRSICTPDWSDMISALGLDVFNARQQFPLSRPATAPTIAVTVCDAGATNCQSVPEDSQNGWTFDPELNAITFHGTSVPGPGEEIHVEYTAVCYQ